MTTANDAVPSDMMTFASYANRHVRKTRRQADKEKGLFFLLVLMRSAQVTVSAVVWRSARGWRHSSACSCSLDSSAVSA